MACRHQFDQQVFRIMNHDGCDFVDNRWNRHSFNSYSWIESSFFTIARRTITSLEDALYIFVCFECIWWSVQLFEGGKLCTNCWNDFWFMHKSEFSFLCAIKCNQRTLLSYPFLQPFRTHRQHFYTFCFTPLNKCYRNKYLFKEHKTIWNFQFLKDYWKILRMNSS